MEQNRYQSMLNTLKGAGFRITPQRRMICRLLASSDQHPSAQMIFEELRRTDDSLSLATVYNTLDALSGLGVINILGEMWAGDATRYDADISPHVNLACVHCHRILDVPSQHIHSLVQEVEQNSGFALLGARVLYYGLCPECQAASTQKGSNSAYHHHHNEINE